MSRVINTVESQVTPPRASAMSVEWARKHIKAVTNAEDVLVRGWIEGATQYFEELTNRAVVTQTFDLWLDAFPANRGKIELPHPPLQSVVSVSYLNSNGDEVTFDDGASPVTLSYSVIAPRGDFAPRGWIEPAYGFEWPTPRSIETKAVRVRFTCGYGDSADAVPKLLTSTLAFLVGNFDQFRSAAYAQQGQTVVAVPYGVQVGIDRFKYSAYPQVVMRSVQ